MGAPLMAERLGPYFACYFCGGRVEDVETAYRCQEEGVRWEKTETRLLVRVDGALLRGSTRSRGSEAPSEVLEVGN